MSILWVKKNNLHNISFIFMIANIKEWIFSFILIKYDTIP